LSSSAKKKGERRKVGLSHQLPVGSSKATRAAVIRKATQSRGDPVRFQAIVFDGDDTLWKTQQLYESAKDRFERLCKNSGLWDKSIREYVDVLDSRRVKLHGFSQSRFPGSLVETLNVYRTLRGLPPSKKATTAALRIGKGVFSRKAPLQSGARTVLRELARKYRLILVTKGSRPVQQRRVSESGLEKYFHMIYIVEDKTTQVLRSICRREELNPYRVLFVGDSLRSDVRPALAIGATAVWIPSRSWRFERGQQPRSKRFIELTALRGLLKLL
jgi:putative hydrolase of the HAD superfamily